MDRLEHTMYSLAAVALGMMCWFSTNFVAARQYHAVFGDGKATILGDAIARCGEYFPFSLAFSIPALTVTFLWFNKKARLAWFLVALGTALLPLLEWDDQSKEIIVDGVMLTIHLLVLPVAAMVTFLVLVIPKIRTSAGKPG